MDWLAETQEQLLRAWAYLTTGRVLATVFGIGFALLAVTLWIASRTKRGQTKALTKCVLVSVLLHVWLLMYALGSPKILPQGSLDEREQNISIYLEPQPGIAEKSNAEAAAENSVSDHRIATLPEMETGTSEAEAPSAWNETVPLSDLPKPPELADFDPTASLAPALLPALEPTPMPALAPEETLADTGQPDVTSEDSDSHDSSAELSSTDYSATSAVEPSPPESQPRDSVASLSTAPTQAEVPASSTRSSPTNRSSTSTTAPREYQLRQAPNRLKIAQAFGADADSEAAVAAALRWLANAQAEDGSWNAAQYGAGEERYVFGESRHGTGDKADTGVSGLALLAFLSAGHTHLAGEYQTPVARGLSYLLRVQMPSGDLSGPKQVGNNRNVLNARMYCHSIASLALAEAYAMTHDTNLRDGLLRAVQYSVNAQDTRGGGWRYKPRDPGDLSQFGWQAMALRSVERSGIQIPSVVKRRMRQFLDSCAAGQYGGLATYRPRAGRPSETMTAEALACRLLIGYPLSSVAQQEATKMIMVHRPQAVQSQPGNVATETRDGNVYFWYYATLALFQLQDENWRVWNQALKARLLATQVPAYGSEPGSWNPDTLWAGYGGRVYSTAMSCLCLEVYYRYLPLYQNAELAQQPSSATYPRR